jgi:hypothetical protein
MNNIGNEQNLQLTVVHEEEAESDIVKNEIHPISETDRFLHRLPK